jgi:putative exporter of polyketide antibiotics
MATAVSVTGLVKTFGATRALDGLDLSWTPTAPVETWAVGRAAVLLTVAATLLAAGFTGFRQRDLLTS